MSNSAVSWTVSRVPAEVDAFKQVSALLDRWGHIAEDNEKTVADKGEKEAALKLFELYMITDMMRHLISRYAGDLQKTSVAALKNRVILLVVKNEAQETRAIALCEKLNDTGVRVDCLATHPENIPSSIAKRVSGAASALILHLQAMYHSIELSSGGTSGGFYTKLGFSEPVSCKRLFVKSSSREVA